MPISIHALLAESDLAPEQNTTEQRDFYPRSPCGERRDFRRAFKCAICNFYPRSPCGERPGKVKLVEPGLVFLSTLSLRRATGYEQCCTHDREISIHALLAESDSYPGRNGIETALFLSTLSLRRATAKVHKTVGHFCAYETNFMGIASSC